MASSSALPPLSSRSFLVLYASQTGTAVDISHRIARRGRREGWSVAVQDVATFDQAELWERELIVWVMPTAGGGVPPVGFNKLWNSLLHPGLPGDLLEDLRFALFGLGDSSYPKYQWVARKVMRRLESLGAHAVIAKGEGDDQNEWGIESTFPAWLDSFFGAVDSLAPLPAGFNKPTIDSLPPSRIRMVRAEGDAKVVTADWTKDVRWAKIIKNERITTSDWFQDVRSFELETEDGEGYPMGAVLELRPQNSPESVDSFLTSIGWIDQADIPYSITSSSTDAPLPSHLPIPYVTTLRHLLTHELDISAVPRLTFFEWLAQFSEGDMQEKLRWFCAGEGQDDLNDYTHRPRRTITEVMYEFRAAKVPIEYCMDLLPAMVQRGFSVASASNVHPKHVDLLVAIVNYKSTMSVPRTGVCTDWISRLKTGTRVPMRIVDGTLVLPALVNGVAPPLVMVGPGTGVAPFRALVEERTRLGQDENLVFFGCRSVKQDYFYKDQWAAWEKEGKLTMSVAASRDQEDKIYVQHRIREQATLVWDYVSRGASIYICGSSKNMPKSVKKAFVEVFEKTGGLGEGKGEARWEEMDRAGRIVEETW